MWSGHLEKGETENSGLLLDAYSLSRVFPAKLLAFFCSLSENSQIAAT
jgi:hypothetical protein